MSSPSKAVDVTDEMIERGMDGAWNFVKEHADYVGPDDADWRTVRGEDQQEVENMRAIVRAVLVAALQANCGEA